MIEPVVELSYVLLGVAYGLLVGAWLLTRLTDIRSENRRLKSELAAARIEAAKWEWARSLRISTLGYSMTLDALCDIEMATAQALKKAATAQAPAETESIAAP